MFINVNVCFLVSIETHASSRLGGHGSQDRLCKTRILRPYESWKRGLGILSKLWQLFLPHTNYCNVGTIELYLVGEIKHGHGQEK